MREKKKHCIYCGTKLPAIAQFCSNCGKPQSEEEQQSTAHAALKNIMDIDSETEKAVDLLIRLARTGPVELSDIGLGVTIYVLKKRDHDFKGKSALLEMLQVYKDANDFLRIMNRTDFEKLMCNSRDENWLANDMHIYANYGVTGLMDVYVEISEEIFDVQLDNQSPQRVAINPGIEKCLDKFAFHWLFYAECEYGFVDLSGREIDLVIGRLGSQVLEEFRGARNSSIKANFLRWSRLKKPE